MRANPNDIQDFLAGGGEMGRLIRAFDWSKTSIGSPETWSPALRTLLRMLLANRFPHILWWGPDYIQFYNDSYIPIPGTMHPNLTLGRPARECWREIWHVIGPLIDRPFRGGPATWDDDIYLEVNRSGFVEETHFTIAYSPVPDESAPGGIGGVLATVHEITGKVVGERRVVLLRDLAARLTHAKIVHDVCVTAVDTLQAHDKDVPFAAFFLSDGASTHPRLVAATRNVPQKHWSFGEDLAVADGAAVIPISKIGYLVVGISPLLRLDQFYRDFLGLLRTQVTSAVSNALAFEAEKERAEALAEIDRAKTTFFSNISHEFRTPLTLMLGPFEELLNGSAGELPPAAVSQLKSVNRNALRLLRLVNALLDFSRIEAGRVRARYQATDIAAFTSSLAVMFHTAMERGGLRLIVNCNPLSLPVFLDPEMWEKIVFNLLSNAFKYTLRGEIEVKLVEQKTAAELTIRDTGTGIPQDQIPRLFERFHRVENAKARTHEGSGIGLALVHELVKLHGGSVKVESVLGKGSSFIVSVPFGSDHLPSEQIRASTVPSAAGTKAYVEEALRWLPDVEELGHDISLESALESRPSENDDRPRVLLADDSADMRRYVARLLSRNYQVEVVSDGEAALAAARKRLPDLILTDVMMPRLDGFGLIQAIKCDPELNRVPVVMLSARAGEESRIEGIQVGADDYLVKPFSGRELVARVDAHVKMARLRRESEESLRRAKEKAEAASIAKDNFLATLSHELRTPLTPVLATLSSWETSHAFPASLASDLAIVRRNIDLEARLIDDLLDLTRIVTGKFVLHFEVLDVQDLLDSVLAMYRGEINAKRINLTRRYDAKRRHVRADPGRLQQVFWNVLRNAVKFTPESGQIEVVTRDGVNSHMQIMITDTGIGISAEMMRRLFQPFEQETAGHYGGLGLGLAITRTVLEAQSGRIEATSEGPGRGASFIITLPCLARPVTQSIGKAPSTPDTGRAESSQDDANRRLRVLLVEDHVDTAQVLARLLSKDGHTITMVGSIAQAETALRSGSFDLLLSDVGLPDGTGIDLIRLVRGQYRLKLPAIALTGFGMEDDVARTKQAGFNEHLTKPVNLMHLQQAIHRVCKDLHQSAQIISD